MTSPSEPHESGQPHVVQLVLASKKAFHHGEQLCIKARTLSTESAQAAVDVLTLDAKVRWISQAVIEQLKLATSIAKSIEQKRAELEAQAKNWDLLRNQRTGALDNVLESLGSQSVPPDFYSTSPVSSLFGSQHGSDDEEEPNGRATGFLPGQSPTETLRGVLHNGISRQRQGRLRENDRSKWKTLRDFVDERAIEDILEDIESNRNILDDILARISDYPESLRKSIDAIKESLPPKIPVPPMAEIFASQEATSKAMAELFEGLMSHYDQMTRALHESEEGEEFSEDDMQEMNRDTSELPSIIADLDRHILSIEKSHTQLVTAKRDYTIHLQTHRDILRDLDELGEIVTEMLERQQLVETDSDEQLSALRDQLTRIDELHGHYTTYQYSYCKLVVELARRRQYKEAATKIVLGMAAQLEALVEEERQQRDTFNKNYGDHLPLDVCLQVQNSPTRWEVVPFDHDVEESIPDIEQDILQEAMNRIVATEGALTSSQSL